MSDAEIGFILSAIGQFENNYNKTGLDLDKEYVKTGRNLLDKLTKVKESNHVPA